jgi:hypothetical protein
MPHVAAKHVLGLVKIFILTWAGIEPENPWKQTVTLPLSYSAPSAPIEPNCNSEEDLVLKDLSLEFMNDFNMESSIHP